LSQSSANQAGRPRQQQLLSPNVQKTKKRRKMSAEGRERVRQAQIKRWAALKAHPYERYRCATAQGEEEGRKGCLM
jgi:hypothetical protein